MEEDVVHWWHGMEDEDNLEEDVVHWWHGMEDEDNLVTGVDKKSENPERGKSEKKKMFSSSPPHLGRCFNCGESSHWARDCEFEDLKNKCYHCRERGHIRRNYPKLYSKANVEQIEEMEIDVIPVVKIEHDGASNGLDINCPCAEFGTPLVSLSSGAAETISSTIGLKRKIDLFNEERDSLLRNKKRRFERLEYDGKVLLSLGSEVFKEAMTQLKKEAKRGGLYIDQGEGQEAQAVTHLTNEEAQDGSIWNNNGKDSFRKRNVACYEDGHVLALLRWHSLSVLEHVISPIGYPDESTPNIDYGLELPREVLKINACFNVDVNGVHYALVEDNHKMFSVDNSLPQCHHSQQLFLSTGSPFSTADAIDDCCRSKLTPPYCSPTTKGRIWDASQSNAGNISQRNSLFPMRLVPQPVIAQSNSEGRHIDSSRVPSIGHHSTDVGYSLQEVNDREQSPLTTICPLPTTDSSHSLTVEFLRNLLGSKLDRKGDNTVGNDRIALKAVVSLNEKTTPDDNLSIEDFCQQQDIHLVGVPNIPYSNNKFGDFLFEAAWSLTNIISRTSDHTKTVIDHGALAVFVQLLTSMNENARHQAVWALGNIAGEVYKMEKHTFLMIYKIAMLCMEKCVLNLQQVVVFIMD